MKTIISVLILSLLSLVVFAQGVAVNTTGNAPNSNSILDVSSDNKGVLFSRLTTVARNTLGTALTNTDNGMFVYDKDLLVFFYWDGTQWVQVGAGTGSDNQNLTGATLTGTSLQIDIEDGNSTTVDLSSLQDGVNDADSNPTNEIQDLSLNTTTNILTITNNGSATSLDLTPYIDNTDNQTLSLSGSTLSISNGNNVTFTDNVNDADSNPNNEIELPTGGTNGQVLSTDGSGGYSWVSDANGTDDQNINGSGLSGTVLTIGIENGTNETVDLQSLIPTGAVMAFNLATCPTGWVKANGTGGTPDLRGEFVRGLDDGRGVDAARVLGAWQKPSIIASDHSGIGRHMTLNHNTTLENRGLESPGANGYSLSSNISMQYSTSTVHHYTGPASAYVNNPPGSAYNNPNPINGSHSGTSRPRNIALLYCIKQ